VSRQQKRRDLEGCENKWQVGKESRLNIVAWTPPVDYDEGIKGLYHGYLRRAFAKGEFIFANLELGEDR